MLLLTGISVAEFHDVLQPFLDFHSQAIASFTEVSSQQLGDELSAQMKTDDGHEAQLCDQVMEQIYSLAEKNSTALKLKLALQVTGKPDVTVAVEDLDAVRKYRNKKGYTTSGHRAFVGAPLVTAGLIAESSLVVPASGGGGPDIVGNSYQIDLEVSPKLGVKFLDDSQVQILKDGVPEGSPENYYIEGNTVVIPSETCATLRFQIQDGHLILEGTAATFSQQ